MKLWDNFKWTNIFVKLESPKEGGRQKKFEEKWLDVFQI